MKRLCRRKGQTRMFGQESDSNTRILLSILSGMFFGRVLGQFCVVSFNTPLLPPNEQWMSGLLPYRYLLLSQVLILAAMCSTIRSIGKKRQFWHSSHPRLGLALKVFAWFYLLVMVIRFGVYCFKQFHGQVFLGGWIPPVFHWVLAAFLILVSERIIRGPAKR